VGAPVPPAEAAARAREALAQLAALEERAGRLLGLEQDLEHAQAQSERQRSYRARVVAVATPEHALQTPAAIRDAHADVGASLEDALAETRELRARARAVEADQALFLEDVRRLELELPRWRSLQREAQALGAEHEVALQTAGAVEVLEARLRDARDQRREEQQQATTRRREVKAAVRALRDRGGCFPDALLRLRDTLDASLYTERYEETREADAPAIEARLGPLREALLVEDPESAAASAARLGLDVAWFLVDTSEEIPEPTIEASLNGGVLVRQGSAWRWSRYPERPVVGRAARERRIQALEGELETLDEQLQMVDLALVSIARDQQRAGALRASASRLEAPDPAPKLARARQQVEQLRAEHGELERAAAVSESLERAHRAWRDALGALLPDSSLLDPPDWIGRALEVEALVSEARAARQILLKVAPDRESLRAHRDDLSDLPLSEETLQALTRELEAVAAERRRWRSPLPQLRYLSEHLEHLEWGGWASNLKERAALRPALQRQLDVTRRRLDDAQREEERAGEEFESARSLWIESDGRFQGTRRDLQQEGAALDALGVSDPSGAAVRAAERSARSIEARVQIVSAEERDADRALVRATGRQEALQETLASQKVAAQEAERQHLPWR